jgi:hypothetical protein
LPGSPAIDAGDDSACPPTDQRGVTCPQDGNDDGTPICDIGAYERVGTNPIETRLIDPGDALPVDFPMVGLTVDCSSGPGGTITVTRYPGAHPSPPSGVGTMIGYWKIVPDFAGYVCDLIFHYDEGDLNGAAEGDVAGAARWDEGNVIWGYYGGSVDMGADTVTIPDVIDFSAWLILTSTPPRAVADLGGTRSGSDLQLAWLAVTEDILGGALVPDHYVVYRRVNEPYFQPGAGDIIATPSTAAFTGTGVLGDPGQNHYYVVTAVDGAGVESAGSQRLGAFGFDLTPASVPSERAYNLIALPLEMPTVVDADTLASYVGPGVYMILRHDAATQGIAWRLPGLAGTSFSLGLGQAPYLYVDETVADGVSLVGVVPLQFHQRAAAPRRPAGCRHPGGGCRRGLLGEPLQRRHARPDLADAGRIWGEFPCLAGLSLHRLPGRDSAA